MDKLMIKDAEYFANKMAKKMDYVHHEVSNDDGSSTSCDMESILRQLANTMRENEGLRKALNKLHSAIGAMPAQLQYDKADKSGDTRQKLKPPKHIISRW